MRVQNCHLAASLSGDKLLNSQRGKKVSNSARNAMLNPFGTATSSLCNIPFFLCRVLGCPSRTSAVPSWSQGLCWPWGRARGDGTSGKGSWELPQPAPLAPSRLRRHQQVSAGKFPISLLFTSILHVLEHQRFTLKSIRAKESNLLPVLLTSQ